MNQNDMDLNNVGIVLSRVSPAGSVTVSIPGSRNHRPQAS